MKTRRIINVNIINNKKLNNIKETSSQTIESIKPFNKINTKYKLIIGKNKLSPIQNNIKKNLQIPFFEKKKFPVSVSLKTLFINKEENNSNENNEIVHSFRLNPHLTFFQKLKQYENIRKNYYREQTKNKSITTRNSFLHNNKFVMNNIENYNNTTRRFLSLNQNKEINNRKDFEIITENFSFNLFKNKLLKEKIIPKKKFEKSYKTIRTITPKLKNVIFENSKNNYMYNKENSEGRIFRLNKSSAKNIITTSFY
jgi:hypothetical protein